MNHSDFKIGTLFRSGHGFAEWRCTDVGTRVITAIRLDRVEKCVMENGEKKTIIMRFTQARDEGWFNGPPYAVHETVFDEDDMEDCELLGFADEAVLSEDGK